MASKRKNYTDDVFEDPDDFENDEEEEENY